MAVLILCAAFKLLSFILPSPFIQQTNHSFLSQQQLYHHPRPTDVVLMLVLSVLSKGVLCFSLMFPIVSDHFVLFTTTFGTYSAFSLLPASCSVPR